MGKEGGTKEILMEGKKKYRRKERMTETKKEKGKIH